MWHRYMSPLKTAPFSFPRCFTTFISASVINNFLCTSYIPCLHLNNNAPPTADRRLNLSFMMGSRDGLKGHSTNLMHENSRHVWSALLDAPVIDKTWFCALSCAVPLDFFIWLQMCQDFLHTGAVDEAQPQPLPSEPAGHQTRSEHSFWNRQTAVWRQYGGGSLRIWSELWHGQVRH